MKKPRKPKAKRKSVASSRAGQASIAPVRAATTERRGTSTSSKKPIIRRSIGTVAVTYDRDQRAQLTLLLLPFFMVAFALGMSETLRRGARLDVAPASIAAVRLSQTQLRAAPHHAYDRPAAPAETAPAPSAHRIDDPFGHMARLELPVRAPAVELPQASIGPPSVLATTPPSSDLPEMQVTQPAMRQPASRPPTLAFEVAPAPTPAAHLPRSAPLVGPPEAATTASPGPTVAPALTSPLAPSRRQRSQLDLCVAAPGLGRHVHPAIASDDGPRSTEQFGSRIAAAALAQTDDFVIYNDKYRRIAFPMGDVSPLFGVCTDVVIRAYRSAGVDLQELVHRARLGGDTSIDHRRTETLRRFFATHGQSLPVTSFAEDYVPGDIVTYHRPQNRRSRSHIAVVSDKIAPSGRPLIIHNRGWGPQAEDALFVDQITGHYRFAPQESRPTLEASRPPAKRTASFSRALVKASFGPPLGPELGARPAPVQQPALAEQPGATPEPSPTALR